MIGVKMRSENLCVIIYNLINAFKLSLCTIKKQKLLRKSAEVYILYKITKKKKKTRQYIGCDLYLVENEDCNKEQVKIW